MKAFPTLVLGIALLGAGAAGWWIRGNVHFHDGAPGPGAARRIRFYQSPMHPWIKSDQPGLCTICGMKLVPVYEGDEELQSPSVVTLGSNTPSIAGIATTAVGRRPIVRSMRVAGTIDDDDSRHRILPAYVEGRIEELHVHHVGAEVTAGQPLATFYSPALLGAVREYLALAGTPESGSTLGAASALRLRQMGLGADQIAALPTTFKPDAMSLPLLSPVSGTVVKRVAYAGQFVREGDPLFELGDFAVMWFKFDAYERDLPWLHVGQTIVVTTPSVPGTALTNTIAFIDPNLEEMSRTARVRVELPNPFVGEGPNRVRLLRHRLYAEGRIEVATAPLLAVPRSAVLNPDGRPFVWKAVGPTSFERREVVLGRRGDQHWEVVSGLAEGDRIVSAGGFLVDAQAQLQHGDVPSATPSRDAATNAIPSLPAAKAGAVEPTEPQWVALEGVLQSSSNLAAALASDDLKSFHRLWPEHVTAVHRLGTAASGLPREAFAGLLALPAAPKDIAGARAALHGFMDGLLPWAPRLKARPGLGGIKAYECPMTGKTFPGAPREAHWLQLKGPTRNPWFGAEMPDCGTEIAL